MTQASKRLQEVLDFDQLNTEVQVNQFLSGFTPLISSREQDELILKHRVKARKLTKSILRKWNARLDPEDIDSIVNVSLCESARRFDPSKGASFMTFTYFHLKGNLIRHVTSASKASAISQEPDERIFMYDEEINSYKNINSLCHRDIIELYYSVDDIVDDPLVLKENRLEVLRAIDELDPLEKTIIERLYFKGEPLMNIADSLGYSRCHVSRIKKRAMMILALKLNSSFGFCRRINKEMKESGISDVKRFGIVSVLPDSFDKKKIRRRRPRSKAACQA